MMWNPETEKFTTSPTLTRIVSGITWWFAGVARLRRVEPGAEGDRDHARPRAVAVAVAAFVGIGGQEYAGRCSGEQCDR